MKLLYIYNDDDDYNIWYLHLFALPLLGEKMTKSL